MSIPQLISSPQLGGSKPYTPFPYQKRAIKFLVSQACGGLFLDPGLGKTSITLAAVKLLGGLGYIKGALVIAPLRAVYLVWPLEIQKWRDFHDLSIGILHDDTKETVLREDHHIYAINPEGTMWIVDYLLRTPKENWPFDTLIVDESTKFKDSQTHRFKALRKVIPHFKRRYILTGTPSPNGLLDLFGQIYILDVGNSLGRFITHYKNEYFFSSGYGGYTWTPRLDSMERISRRIAPLVLRMTREEYLQLPDLVQNMVWLDLPEDARRVYRDLEKEFIAQLGDDIVIAPSAAAAGVKCRQILNGAIYTSPDRQQWRKIHDVKLKALEDLVEELSGQPLLVLYEFQHDKERLVEKFSKFGLIGGQSMKKDIEVVTKFNMGALPGVIGHPASMGHALNLQGECAHVAWFGLTWNFEHYDQSIQRVWRQGNKAQRVIVYHFCIRNSLDESVVQTLNSKDRTQGEFLRQVRLLR
jgi:SNF2 family DNA or RNA helicase